jgi:hypothetical protein
MTDEERWGDEEIMREEAESENEESKRTSARESLGMHERSEEGWHVGLETVTRLRIRETKEQQLSKRVRDRFWGESYQQPSESTTEIRSYSPEAKIFTIMWRCMVGGLSDQYCKTDIHGVNFSMPSSISLSLRWLIESSS